MIKTKSSVKLISAYVGAAVLAIAFVVMSLPLVASAQTLTRQLQLGMSGSDVSALQSYLAKDATIYPQGLVTGYFGTLTRAAVSNFQARFGIATVGRVGPITLAALNARMNLDNVAPTISAVSISPTNNSATISWNTNETAAAVLYYGTSPLSMTEGSPTSGVTIGGSSMLANTNQQLAHSVTLTSLNANTTYHYVIYVKDSTGNESVTWPSTFTTN